MKAFTNSMSSYGFPSLAVPRVKDISSQEPCKLMTEYSRPDDSTKYSSKFLQTEQEIRSLKSSLDTRSSMLWDNLQNVGGGNSSFTNSVSRSSFVTPRNHDTLKTTTLSRPLAFAMPTSNDSFTRPDYDIGTPVKYMNEPSGLNFRESQRKPMAWQGIDAMFNHKPISLNTDNEMPWAKTSTLAQQDDSLGGLRDFISSHKSKLHQERGRSIYNAQEPLEQKQIFETPQYNMNNVAGYSTNVNNKDDRYNQVPVSLKTEGVINPSSDKYLNRLDAHLENMVGKVLHADDNQWTQTYTRPGLKTDPIDKVARMRRGRSSSVEETKPPKSATNRNVNYKLRSASVPRPKARKWSDGRNLGETMTVDKNLKDITLDELMALTSELRNKYKTKAKTQKPVSNRKKAPTVACRNKCQNYRSNDNGQRERESLMADMKGSLDKRQQNALKGFLADMTRAEGDILMGTVRSILKSRLAKRTVAFRDEKEPLLVKPGENVNKDVRDNELNDEPFIPSYSQHIECPGSVSSSETQFLTASNSDKSLEYYDSMSSASSPDGRKYDRVCNVYLLTEEQDRGRRRSFSRLRRHNPKITPSEIPKAGQRPSAEPRGPKLRYEGKKTVSCPEIRQGKSSCFRSCSVSRKEATTVVDKEHGVKQKASQPVCNRWICTDGHNEDHITLRPNRRYKKGNVTLLDNSDHRINRRYRRSRTNRSSERLEDKSILKIGNDKRMMNRVSVTVSTQTDSRRIRTPTPSPPVVHELCLSVKHNTEEPINSDNLNASCSTTSPTDVLRVQSAKIDLDALSFDDETCLTETSLSQKMADLNLTVEHHEESKEILDSEKQESPTNSPETLKSTTEYSAADFTETYFSTNGIVESDNSVLVHINKNTKDLLEKANEKMKRVELILDSISNTPSVILPLTGKESGLDDSTQDWTCKNIPRLDPPLKEMHVSDISLDSKTLEQHRQSITFMPSQEPKQTHPGRENGSGMAVGQYKGEKSVTPCVQNIVNGMKVPSLRGNAMPVSISVSKESTVGALNSITKFSIQSSCLFNRSTVLTTTSSTSLVSSTTDSPLPSSSGSDMAVVKFNKSSKYGEYSRQHCGEKVPMTKNAFQNNNRHHKRGVLSHKKPVHNEISKEAPQVLVKTHDVAKPMLLENRKISLHGASRKPIQTPFAATGLKTIKDPNQLHNQTSIFDAKSRPPETIKKTIAGSNPKAVQTSCSDTRESTPKYTKSVVGSDEEANHYSLAKTFPLDNKTKAFVESNIKSNHTSSIQSRCLDKCITPIDDSRRKTIQKTSTYILPLESNKKPPNESTDTSTSDPLSLNTNTSPLSQSNKNIPKASATNIRVVNTKTRPLNETSTKIMHTSTKNTPDLDINRKTFTKTETNTKTSHISKTNNRYQDVGNTSPPKNSNLKATQTSATHINSQEYKARTIMESNQQSTQTSFCEDSSSGENERTHNMLFESKTHSTYHSQIDIQSPHRAIKLPFNSNSERFLQHPPTSSHQCLRPVHSPVTRQTAPTAQSEDLTKSNDSGPTQQSVNRKFLRSLQAHKSKVEQSKSKHNPTQGNPTSLNSIKPSSKNVLHQTKSSRLSLAKKKVTTKLPPFRF